MRMKCPECELTFVWTPGAPDPDFGELLPAPRKPGRAYCPLCRRHLWKTDHRWKTYPIHHRPPLEGPTTETAIARGFGMPLRLPATWLRKPTLLP